MAAAAPPASVMNSRRVVIGFSFGRRTHAAGLQALRIR